MSYVKMQLNEGAFAIAVGSACIGLAVAGMAHASKQFSRIKLLQAGALAIGLIALVDVAAHAILKLLQKRYGWQTDRYLSSHSIAAFVAGPITAAASVGFGIAPSFFAGNQVASKILAIFIGLFMGGLLIATGIGNLKEAYNEHQKIKFLKQASLPGIFSSSFTTV